MYKIAIGSNIIKGPWGGGNQFVVSLINYLKGKGWQTSDKLKDKNIDLILLTEPRITSKTSSFNQREIARYIFHNPYTIAVSYTHLIPEKYYHNHLHKNQSKFDLLNQTDF